MSRVHVWIIFILLVSLCMSSSAWAETSRTTEILSSKNILAASEWNFNGDNSILCVVTKTGDDDHTGIITFYNKVDNSTVEKTFAFEPECYFCSMFPLGNDGNLVTVWETGSSVHLTIFSIIDDKIEAVMDEGMGGFPEIADIDNDGEFEIITSYDKFLVNYKTNEVIQKPQEAQIYKWDGKTYRLIDAVPWQQRLTKRTVRKSNR